MFYPILASLSNSDNISFDFDSGSGYSSLTPSSCTPPHTLNYMPFHFSADASTWLNPSAPINVATSRRRDTLPTAGPGEHSITFSDPWRGKAGAEDGYEPCWESPSADAPANSVDAVSAAFLQLIEAHGWDANTEVVRRLLFDSCLRQEDLLDLVDWRRLLKLAASASHVLRYAGRSAAWLMPSTTHSRHLKFDHSPNSLATNATTTLSDLEEVYHSAEFLPLADTTPGTPINDYELHGMQPLSPSDFSNDPAGPAFPSGTLDFVPTASTIPGTPSTIFPTLLIPPPPILLHPSSPELPPEPPIEPAELHQPAPDAATAPKRRCLDCQAEHTKQWRTHPELPGYLCNACGQHQAKHKSPRSNLAIRRERTRASDKYAATVPTRPSSPPEKRGGEVIMRVRGMINMPARSTTPAKCN